MEPNFSATRERLVGVELAGDDQLCVVGLVVLAVEGLQALDRHVFEVGARADGRVAVVVPQVRDRVHAFGQHPERTVFAGLPFVAHHRHLRLEILGGDERINHPVRFQVERPFEVVGCCRERLEVVGAVEPGRAVRQRTPFAQLLGDVRVAGRALEHQVLQKVRHAGLAVALVPGTDEVRDVHRRLRRALVGEEEDPETVLEAVFGDSLDAGDQLGRLRRGGRRGEGGQRQEESGAGREACVDAHAPEPNGAAGIGREGRHGPGAGLVLRVLHLLSPMRVRVRRRPRAAAMSCMRGADRSPRRPGSRTSRP